MIIVPDSLFYCGGNRLVNAEIKGGLSFINVTVTEKMDVAGAKTGGNFSFNNAKVGTLIMNDLMAERDLQELRNKTVRIGSGPNQASY